MKRIELSAWSAWKLKIINQHFGATAVFKFNQFDKMPPEIANKCRRLVKQILALDKKQQLIKLAINIVVLVNDKGDLTTVKVSFDDAYFKTINLSKVDLRKVNLVINHFDEDALLVVNDIDTLIKATVVKNLIALINCANSAYQLMASLIENQRRRQILVIIKPNRFHPYLNQRYDYEIMINDGLIKDYCFDFQFGWEIGKSDEDNLKNLKGWQAWARRRAHENELVQLKTKWLINKFGLKINCYNDYCIISYILDETRKYQFSLRREQLDRFEWDLINQGQNFLATLIGWDEMTGKI